MVKGWSAPGFVVLPTSSDLKETPPFACSKPAGRRRAAQARVGAHDLPTAPCPGLLERIWHYVFIPICVLAFGFLIAPLLVILPLSFNAEPYFTFTEGALCSTLLAAVLGTLAALGLSRAEMPFRNLIMGLLISPMIVPLIITAAGIFFYASLNEFAQLTGSFIGIVLAHTVLGTPFVVITVTATLIGFDRSLVRAGLMCGATPTRAFFKVVLPLILPGVISGALFAFATSFDEIVVVLFVGSVEYQTIPRQMRAGIREEISPIILAVATLLIGLSTLLMIAVEMLRRYNERQRGVSPG